MGLLDLVIVVLLVGWLLGAVALPLAIGPALHVLLVIAAVLLVIRLVQGRRVL